ncbi:hypothetical protein D3C75_984570 [compost metagenome]
MLRSYTVAVNLPRTAVVGAVDAAVAAEAPVVGLVLLVALLPLLPQPAKSIPAAVTITAPPCAAFFQLCFAIFVNPPSHG